MKYLYTIKGMTCGGCKASVEKKLNEIEGVTHVSVNLEKGEATITMDAHIAKDILQKVLPEKFIISEKLEKKIAFENNYTIKEEDKSKLQQLKPL